MTVQARRNLRSFARRVVLYPLFAGLAVAGVGGSYETIQEQVDRNTTAMPGHMVDVGGHRLYMHCTGAASPTVILESRLALTFTDWGGRSPPAFPQNSTGCAQIRGGQGWFGPPLGPQGGGADAN